MEPAHRAVMLAEVKTLLPGFLSAASAWELSIKSSLDKLRLPLPAGRFLEEQLPLNRIELLAITLADLTRVESLPFHHRDPFDRMRVAQAQCEDLTLVTRDENCWKYEVSVLAA